MGVQFEVEGVTVDFPFEPYPLQKEYMKRVILALKYNDNALLESPTGTGKTLCLLCATLAWKRHLKQASPVSLLNQVNPEGSSVVIHSSRSSDHASAASIAGRVTVSSHIIYAARTHSQLSQVAKELKNTTYETTVRILGSRQQFCRHEKVRSAPSTMQQPMCRALVHQRKCHLHNNLEVAQEHWKQEQDIRVHDIEDIVDFAERHRACGYYLSRQNLEEAEVVLVPYNYVFDPNMRKMVGLDKLMSGAVVVLDEAHNLESFCCDSASTSLASGLLAHAIADMGLCKAKFSTLPRPEYTTSLRSMLMPQDQPMEVTVTAQVVDVLAAQLQRLEADMLALPTDVVRERDTGRDGRFLVGLVDRHFPITGMPKLLPALEALQELLYSDGSADGSGSSGSSAPTAESSTARGGQGAHLLTLGQQLRMLHTLAQPANTTLLQLHYRCVVSRETLRRRGGGGALEDEEVTVNMWCFHSGVAMRALVNFGVASIIVTSGTLAPLSSFAGELGVPFAQTLENNHVITEQQLLPMVLARGPAGALLDSSYKNRDDVSALIDAGAALVNVARMVPAGILVFFPSYPALERALGEWCKSTKATATYRPFGANPPFRRESPPWESGDYPPDCIFAQLAKLKTLAVEPRGAASFGDTLIKYRQGISDGPGSVLFGVCRGKASEGIDFSNDMARAVLLMGIPYPALMDPRVVIKRNLMDALHDRARKDGPRDSARLRELGELIPRHVQNMDKLERALREAPMHSRAESERVQEQQRLAAMHTQLHTYQRERSQLQERMSVAAQTGSDWYSQAAFRAVNQALGRVIRHRHDFGCVLLCDSRFAGTHMRRQVCQWLRPWIKDANTFPEAMQLLRSFWKQTVPALRERLASAGVDVNALPALGGGDESPSASSPQESMFVMAKGVFKRIKNATASSAAVQLSQPSLQPTRLPASGFLREADGLTSELGITLHSTNNAVATPTVTPLPSQPHKGGLRAALAVVKAENAPAAPARALQRTLTPATGAGDACLLRVQSARAVPEPARAPTLCADRRAAAAIAAALPPLSEEALRQHCGRIAWPLLLVATPEVHLVTLRSLVKRLAQKPGDANEDELAGALVECIASLPRVLALNKSPTLLDAPIRHPYLEWRPSGERVAPTDTFPQPATELPYASELAYPHARPLAFISRPLFLALLAHASSPRITSAVARVLAEHPAHSALQEDYTAVCSWLEQEVRWSAHVYKEFRAAVKREPKAASSPVKVIKQDVAASVTPALVKSAPVDIKSEQVVPAAPVAQTQPAPQASAATPAQSTAKGTLSRVTALLASCLSPAQGTVFKGLLHELKQFKTCTADDLDAREQCAPLIARFQALFEAAPGSWELAEVMLAQIPGVCKCAWTDLVTTLKPK